jgi:DDE domain
MAASFKGAHFPQDIILACVRWYVAYPLSTRHVEDLMRERGVPVDHATVNRWVVKYSPSLEAAFHRRKRLVWRSWRMDETYLKVKGQWRYLYRAVDKTGQTIDFLLTERRDEQAARRSTPLTSSPHEILRQSHLGIPDVSIQKRTARSSLTTFAGVIVQIRGGNPRTHQRDDGDCTRRAGRPLQRGWDRVCDG